jgi:hypothetical protein
MRILAGFCFSILLAVASVAQPAEKIPSGNGGTGRFAAETALAAKTLEAHGGEKLRKMRSLVIRGSVDVTAATTAQTIPATFITIFSGDKYRIEINNPFQPVQQIYDGTRTSASIRGGFTLPPINRLGFPMLPRLGETGFVITSLPDEKKKKTGFRLTSPEGYFTDFYIDAKTGQIRGYDSTYAISGRTVTTSVEIDKMRVVDGVVVPEKYVQRFDMGQITIFAEFKAKEILVNSPIDDSVFAIDGPQ